MLMLPPEMPSTTRADKDNHDRRDCERGRNIRRQPQHRPTDRGADLTDDKYHFASGPVGNVAPERCRDELAKRERRHQQTDDECRCAEVGHEIRQHRNQHAEADDIDKRDAENRQELADHFRGRYSRPLSAATPPAGRFSKIARFCARPQFCTSGCRSTLVSTLCRASTLLQTCAFKGKQHVAGRELGGIGRAPGLDRVDHDGPAVRQAETPRRRLGRARCLARRCRDSRGGRVRRA